MFWASPSKQTAFQDASWVQPLSSWKQIFLSITSEIKGTAHTVLGSAHSRAGGKGSLWDLTQDKHTLSHSQGLTRGPCALGWLRRTWGSPLFQALSGNIPVRIQVFSSGRAKGLQCSPSHSLREKKSNREHWIQHPEPLSPHIYCALRLWARPHSCPAAALLLLTPPTVHTTARSKQQALVSHQSPRPSLCWPLTAPYFTPSILTYLHLVNGITDGNWPDLRPDPQNIAQWVQ